jgi:hypothetical protein
MGFDIGTVLGGNLGQLFKDIVGTFKADPNEVLKMQELIEQNKAIIEQKQADLQQKMLDADVQMNAEAGENIRAEITSPDPYVRRARATPVWVVSLSLLLYALTFLISCAAKFWGKDVPIPVPPSAYWYICAFIIGGYVGSRIGDRVLGGQGGDVSFLGFKLNSKGD